MAILGASGSIVGGGATEDAAANTIGFNGASTTSADGVDVRTDAGGQGGTGNAILRNSIFSNADLGIDLAGEGNTPNDSLDADTGPNNLQNKPRILSASSTGGTATISGRLDSELNQTYMLRFFHSGSGEGRFFIGQQTATTNGTNGRAVFSFTPDSQVDVGQSVTATASRAGNTSEFSDEVEVLAP